MITFAQLLLAVSIPAIIALVGLVSGQVAWTRKSAAYLKSKPEQMTL